MNPAESNELEGLALAMFYFCIISILDLLFLVIVSATFACNAI